MANGINADMLNQIFGLAQEVLGGMSQEEHQPYEEDLHAIRSNIKKTMAQQHGYNPEEIDRNQMFEYISQPENHENLNIPFSPRILDLLFNSAHKNDSLGNMANLLGNVGNQQMMSQYFESDKSNGIMNLLSGFLGGGNHKSDGLGNIAGILSSFLK